MVDGESAHIRENIQRLTHHSNHHTIQRGRQQHGRFTEGQAYSINAHSSVSLREPCLASPWAHASRWDPCHLSKFSQAEGSASSHGQRRPVPHPASDMELGGVRWTSPTTGHSLLSSPTFTISSVIEKCLQLSLTSLSDKSGRLHCTLSHQVPSKTYNFTAWATMIIKDSARCCCQAPCHNGSA